MIVLKDYKDDLFDFILSSNSLNEPQVGFLDREKLQSLLNQSNYCKVAFYNDEPAGFLLCLPQDIDYGSLNYKMQLYSNYFDLIMTVKLHFIMMNQQDFFYAYPKILIMVA